jgi:hypothetical protein
VPAAEGFDHVVRGDDVVITHHGRRATVLRGEAARRYLADLEDGADEQELAARATGNYRRGNERTARDHPRNRGR